MPGELVRVVFKSAFVTFKGTVTDVGGDDFRGWYLVGLLEDAGGRVEILPSGCLLLGVVFSGCRAAVGFEKPQDVINLVREVTGGYAGVWGRLLTLGGPSGRRSERAGARPGRAPGLFEMIESHMKSFDAAICGGGDVQHVLLCSVELLCHSADLILVGVVLLREPLGETCDIVGCGLVQILENFVLVLEVLLTFVDGLQLLNMVMLAGLDGPQMLTLGVAAVLEILESIVQFSELVSQFSESVSQFGDLPAGGAAIIDEGIVVVDAVRFVALECGGLGGVEA